MTGKKKRENTEIHSNLRAKIIVNTDVARVNIPVKIVETRRPGIEYVHVALNIQTPKRYNAIDLTLSNVQKLKKNVC